MPTYIKNWFATRVVVFLLTALLIPNLHTSFAQRQEIEADLRYSPVRDQLESTETDRGTSRKRSQSPICGVDGTSTLPNTKSSSEFQTMSRQQPPSPPPITPVLGPQSTLFILINFLDNQITPITREDMYAAAFTYERGIANFYAASSYGQISVIGDVAGWFTILYNENGTCQAGNWRVAADQAASNAGYDLTRYSHFVYIWPRNNPSTGVSSFGCGWDGYSAGAYSYINAYVNPNGYFYDGSQGILSDTLIALICHEFGHGLGIASHAATLRCDDGKRTIDNYSNCTTSPTSDLDDVMAYQNPAHELN